MKNIKAAAKLRAIDLHLWEVQKLLDDYLCICPKFEDEVTQMIINVVKFREMIQDDLVAK